MLFLTPSVLEQTLNEDISRVVPLQSEDLL